MRWNSQVSYMDEMPEDEDESAAGVLWVLIILELVVILVLLAS